MFFIRYLFALLLCFRIYGLPLDMKEVNYSHIFVDLDGTLVKQDVCMSLFKKIIYKKPLTALKMVFNLLIGQNLLNIEILNENVDYLDFTKVCFHDELMQFINMKKFEGKTVVLATGAPIKIAYKLNEHLSFIFKDVLGSHGMFKCVSKNKLQAIKKYAPGSKFMYIGDSVNDIEVWKGSDFCGIVAEKKFVKKMQNLGIEFDIEFNAYL